MSYESNLRSILQNLDSELFGKLPQIEKEARILLSYIHGKFPYFTPHDFSHSLNVEENLNWMLPDSIKEKMNAYEIFFLIVASWMHDWGMVGKPDEDPEEIREIHHIRTEKNFEEMYDKLPLTEHEARIVGRICRGHTKENLYSKDYEDVVFGHNFKIRRRFLAAILRMADECDITSNRTPEIVYYSINPTNEAEEEFQKHLSISGVGQLDEKHKICIYAVARDPKGAKTLRKVKEKIQGELDAVKGILATNGLILDVIELRLENRGFVDKPIGIEIDKKRIVELLMGKHLYKRRDVAIRELVQNAIDSCKVKMQIKAGSSCKITLRKPNKDTLEIEDDGMGMDYSTAKRFLSVIGASYYNSEEFKQLIEGKNFEPIATFGIGLLSCFLISKGLVIETMKEGEEPCRFTVGPLEEEWKYEKGAMKNTGTKIVLELNDYGKEVNVPESLKRYFVAPEIDIYYQDYAGETSRLEEAWSMDQMLREYSEELHFEEKNKAEELLRFGNDDYDVILGLVSEPVSHQLVLFNHGIFVGGISLLGSLGYQFMVFVNIKRDLVDLQLSREGVVGNSRLSEFIYCLFKDVFDQISNRWQKDPEKYIHLTCGMLENRASYEANSESELCENNPFLKSFLEMALFPIISRNKVEYQKLDDVLKQDEITLYDVYSRQPLKEIEFVLEFLEKNGTTLLNPYRMPNVKSELGSKAYENLLVFVLEGRKKKFSRVDLASVIAENTALVNGDFEDILPKNVKLVQFPKNWKPLFVVKEPAEIIQVEHLLGSAYFGNLLLWSKLLGEESASKALSFLGRRKKYVECIKLLSEPLIYVDAKDAFIEKVLEIRAKRKLDEKTTEKVLRYFTYLSYLPLAFNDLCSCIIFLEVLNDLEREIASTLQFEQPSQLLKRIEPNCDLYVDYYENCDFEKLYRIQLETEKETTEGG